jgi:hypothetical protein
MTPQQKKLLLPLIILAIGFVSLVGVALFIVSQPAEQRATANIGGQTSNRVRITGTTTITSFGTTYSGPVFVRHSGALKITYDATALITPDKEAPAKPEVDVPAEPVKGAMAVGGLVVRNDVRAVAQAYIRFAQLTAGSVSVACSRPIAQWQGVTQAQAWALLPGSSLCARSQAAQGIKPSCNSSPAKPSSRASARSCGGESENAPASSAASGRMPCNSRATCRVCPAGRACMARSQSSSALAAKGSSKCVGAGGA